jgi:hypothetical protein
MRIGILRSSVVSAGVLVAGLIALGTLASLLSHPVLAHGETVQQANVVMAAQRFAKFSSEQRVAILRAHQSASHPLWKDLTWSARVQRVAMFTKRLVRAMDAGTSPTTADYLGNLTVITDPAAAALALQRQSDCSLSLYKGSYTLNLPPSIKVSATTANYEKVLHNAAGLATQAGAFPNGCGETTLGIGSRRGVYLGKTTQNLYMFAGSGYDHTANSNALYYGTIDPSTLTIHSFSTDLSLPGIAAVAAGDLNGDGLADIVGIDMTSASISVWLSHADGSISDPSVYSLTGTTTEAAVLADFNGDGKVDVIAATRTSTNQEVISVLTGKGDGTLNAAQTLNVPTPSGGIGSAQVRYLLAADLRGSGHQDIVASSGLLLLNNGDGTFAIGNPAFAPISGTSEFGPDVVAADFNKDGKLDLAVSNGLTINIYLGKGDGSFTAGKSYVSINDVGYLTATDLDGDGNIDLFVGLANGGFFGGDQFEVNEVYALMGNGDGSFQGAPALPFIYTGTNLVDLNGDKSVDGVGVNPDLSFTSYLGDGKGGFSAKATLVTSPITLSGQSLALNNIDSYALADVNGDGKPDLVYVAKNFYAPGALAGLFIALGQGDGSFAAASFYAIPSLLPSGNLDINPVLSNIRLADLNNDGKTDLIYHYVDQSYQTQTNYVGTAVQLGNGDGTFQAPQTLLFYSGTNNIFQTSDVVAIADLNKDGHPDLLLLSQSFTVNATLNQYPYDLQVALGDGKGGFSTPTTVASADLLLTGLLYGTQYAPVVVADMNGDGNPDLIVLGSSATGSMQVAIALGNGDGSFKAPIKTDYAAQYLLDNTLAVADFNADGKLDVATFGFIGPEDSGIALGNGDGTLQPLVSASLGTVPSQAIYLNVSGAALASDFNGDGKPDLLAGGTLLLSHAAATATPDYSFGASSVSGTVMAGQSAQTSLTLTPSGNFSGTVSLSCSGLPAGASCSFSPASVMLGTAAATSTLSITTTARSAMNSSRLPFNPLIPEGLLLAGVFVPFTVHRRRRSAHLRQHGLLTLLFISAVLVAGCGGGSTSSGTSNNGGGGTVGGVTGTPAGSYTVTITASGGSLTHTVSYVLKVT